MHETRAMWWLAWRHLRASFVLAIVVAGVAAWTSGLAHHGIHVRIADGWAGLWLLPIAVYSGIAVGSSSPRALAFLFVRPVARGRLLATRLAVAAAALACGLVVSLLPFAGATSPPDPVEIAVVIAMLTLALAAGVLGGLLRESEAVALGIATGLLGSCFVAAAIVPLVFHTTLDRMLYAAGWSVALAIASAAAVILRVAFGIWRRDLPLRSRGGAWRTALAVLPVIAGMQLIAIGVADWSTDPRRGIPSTLLGELDGRLIVAVGPNHVYDAALDTGVDGIVLQGDDGVVVLYDGGAADPPETIHQFERGPDDDWVVVTRAEDVGVAPECYITRFEGVQPTRRVRFACERVAFSPSARVAVLDTDATRSAVIDLAGTQPIRYLEAELLDWRGDVPVWGSYPRLPGPYIVLPDGTVQSIDLAPREPGRREVLDDRGRPVHPSAGPEEGPWLTSNHEGVGALAPDGSWLWFEVGQPSLLRGGPRGYVILDGTVIGIGDLGRTWRHPVPWEVQP